MPSDFGGDSDEPLSFIPPSVLGESADEIVVFVPQQVLGDGSDDLTLYIPTRVKDGTPDELVNYYSSHHYGPPTGSSAVGVPPPRHFGGPTGSAVAAPEAPQVYSAPTAGKTSVPPPFFYGGTTAGRSSALVPPRGFGGVTGGVTGGIPAPINLTATALDAGCIQLNWVDPGPEEDGYRIERSISGMNDWSTIGTVGANVVSFLDRFAVPLVVYDYRVFGFDDVRESLPSNIATAVTPLPPDLPVSPPPTTPTDQPRNRIEPDLVDFKSPGVYGLEKDEEGDVTGFKF